MNRVDEFYDQLFAPLVREEGPLDPLTLSAVVGFDAGGPLSFSTIGADAGRRFVTYVSCELAVRADQVPAGFGRYELLASCDDEGWVRSVLSDIGRMSLEVRFDHHHTLDIRPWVGSRAPIQGVAFEKAYGLRVRRKAYGLLRVIGLTRARLDRARRDGVAGVLSELRASGDYPHITTTVSRGRANQ